jgi:hypothetical protein
MANRLTLYFPEGETVESFWQKIPASRRGERPTPEDADGLWTAIVEILTEAPPGGCHHPEELAKTLGAMNTQPWEDSLAQVRALMDEYRLAPAGAKLFKVDEVPEFSDPDKYWTWRCQFSRFARSQAVPSAASAIALERIAQRFTGRLASYMAHQDVLQFTRASWTQTYEAFLVWADSVFLQSNFYQKSPTLGRQNH